MSKVAMISTGDFAAQVEGDASGAVVVDFTATWCPPCKMLAPVFEKVADKYEGKARFYKVDVDQDVEVAAKYGVQTIPNLLFFHNGQVVDQSVGYVNEAQLSAKVDGVLSN